MSEIVFNWELASGARLMLALAAVALMLLLIIRFKMHAFLALFIVSVLVAVGSGISLNSVMPVIMDGFGHNIATAGLVMGVAAMLGRLMIVSGGADVLAEVMTRWFGPKQARWALYVASLVFGLRTLFDNGFAAMLPILLAVAVRMGGNLLLYMLPAAAGFSVSHFFTPPHPEPVIAANMIGADLGLVMALSMLIAFPVWYLAGFLGGRLLSRRFYVDASALLGEVQPRPNGPRPPFILILTILFLPVALILLNTGVSLAIEAGAVGSDFWLEQPARMFGSAPIAILLTLLLAYFLVCTRDGLEKFVSDALAPAASLMLVIGAGGMFANVLLKGGVSQAIIETLQAAGLPLLLIAFILPAALRIAQGSATVALITASALLAPYIAATPLHKLQLAALVMVIAAGSVVGSHVNDPSFWLVSKSLRLDVKATLRTWTVMQSLIGLVGFGFAAAIFALG